MTCSFELMDLDTGNLVGSYANLEDALTIVRESYAAHGLAGVSGLGVIAVCDNGAQQMISADMELARLAIGDDRAIRTSRRSATQPAPASDKASASATACSRVSTRPASQSSRNSRPDRDSRVKAASPSNRSARGMDTSVRS
jgi:hypothetical protein